MKEYANTKPGTQTETLATEKLFTGIVNRGFIYSITAKTIDNLCDQINAIKTPNRIVQIMFGEGRYHAIIEFDRKVKAIVKGA